MSRSSYSRHRNPPCACCLPPPIPFDLVEWAVQRLRLILIGDSSGQLSKGQGYQATLFQPEAKWHTQPRHLSKSECFISVLAMCMPQRDQRERAPCRPELCRSNCSWCHSGSVIGKENNTPRNETSNSALYSRSTGSLPCGRHQSLKCFLLTIIETV